MRHNISVALHGLFYKTTIHEPRKYRLKKMIERMRDSFEAGELNGVDWIYGKSDLADCLTKWNIQLSESLNDMLKDAVGDKRLYGNWRFVNGH